MEKAKSVSEIDKRLGYIASKFDIGYGQWLLEKQSAPSSKHGNKSTNGDSSATPDSSGKGRRSKANCVETRSKLPGQPIRGFENETLFLKNFLMKRKESEEFKTLAIVGKFGVGKTTLCQYVFNEKDVKQAYLPRIWVSMYSKETTEDEDPRIDAVKTMIDVVKRRIYVVKRRIDIVKRILRSLGIEDKMFDDIKTKAKDEKGSNEEAGKTEKETVTEKELSRLLDALNSNLIGKKYLIVLDDVWEDDQWNQRLDDEKIQQEKSHLSCGFPKGFGGRVIVTSRDESLAKEIVGEEKNLQRLFPRSDHESVWEIYKDAFEEPMKDEAGRPKKDVVEKIVTEEDGNQTEFVLNPRYPGRFKQELMDKSCGVPWAARELAKIKPLKRDEDKDK